MPVLRRAAPSSKPNVSAYSPIFMARKSGIDERVFEPLLENLFLAARVRDDRRIRELLRELIPTAKIENARAGWTHDHPEPV